MEQPHLAAEGTPFGVIATTLGNNVSGKHPDREYGNCFDRCTLANEMTVNDTFPGCDET